MSIEVIQDTQIIVHAAGDIDVTSIVEVRKAFDEAIERAPKGFIIDLTDATYIDSAGVQAIIVTYLKVKGAEGCLALVVGNTIIRRVLEAVHLELLPRMLVYDDLDGARQGLLAAK